VKIIEIPDQESANVGNVCRRIFDLLFAGTALILLSPLIAVISAAIWLESGGPMLYVQTRIGRLGVSFRMYKFRKFHASCDDSGMPLTLTEDERMTEVGKILRSTKLDEIPQLWNVFEGSMSIVGPRPESMAFADCFTGGMEKVLEHKPGIFGPSQMLFRNESVFYSDACSPAAFYRRYLFPAKAQIDLAYYPKRTLANDVIWAMRSLFAVLGFSGPATAPLTPDPHSSMSDNMGSEVGVNK